MDCWWIEINHAKECAAGGGISRSVRSLHGDHVVPGFHAGAGCWNLAQDEGGAGRARIAGGSLRDHIGHDGLAIGADRGKDYCRTSDARRRRVCDADGDVGLGECTAGIGHFECHCMHAGRKGSCHGYVRTEDCAAFAPLISKHVSIRVAGGAGIQSEDGRAFDNPVRTCACDRSGIARHQVQHKPGVELIVRAGADDAAGIVDELGAAQLPTGIGRKHSIQIEHGAILPQKCVRAVVADSGIANHLSFIVERVGVTVIATQRAQVGHRGVVVNETVRLAIISGRGEADDLPGVVDGDGLRERSSQSADVHHRSSRIDKGVDVARVKRRFTNGHSGVIEGDGRAVISTQGAQVQQRAVFAEESVVVESLGQRVTGNLAQLVERRDIGSATSQVRQIGHRAVGIEEGLDHSVACGQRFPCDLAGVVN